MQRLTLMLLRTAEGFFCVARFSDRRAYTSVGDLFAVTTRVKQVWVLVGGRHETKATI